MPNLFKLLQIHRLSCQVRYLSFTIKMKNDWDPALYRQFETERTRPAKELFSRIPLVEVKTATDLGCGPGNSTELLAQAWPTAEITGIDTSEAMIKEASERLPLCNFVQQDIDTWIPSEKQDVIFANASLHWLKDHENLLKKLVSNLNPSGVLAIQMPDNLDQPTHALMRKVADFQKWSTKINKNAEDRKKLLTAEKYYDVLSSANCSVDIWRTTYYHVMPSPISIVEWLKSTGLRMFVENLNDEEKAEYLKDYLNEISQVYLPRSDGSVLMAFPRLFMIAQKL